MSFVGRRAANARRAAAAKDVPTDPNTPHGPGGTPGTPPLPGDWGPGTRWGPQNRGHVQPTAGGSGTVEDPTKRPFVPVQPGGGPPPGSIDPHTGMPSIGDPSAGAPPGTKFDRSGYTSSGAATPSGGFALPDGAEHTLGKALGKAAGPLLAQHFTNQAHQAAQEQLRGQGIIQ